jgi:hypothetical protein
MITVNDVVNYFFNLFGLNRDQNSHLSEMGSEKSHLQGLNRFAGRTISYPIHSRGDLDIFECRLQSVFNVGRLTLSGSSIQGQCFAVGTLKAKNCSQIGEVQSAGELDIEGCSDIGNILAAGDFSLADSHVRGNVMISGDSADITNSTLDGALKAANQTVRVANSRIRQIAMMPIYQTEKHEPFSGAVRTTRSVMPQAVELTGANTHVDEITFKDGAIGTVYLKDGAQVGTVIGGRVFAKLPNTF